jgi:DNA-binding NtrC family response regulator
MKRKDKPFLIVDDEPDMCWALQHILKGAGINSEKAFSGCEALELVKPDRFQLAFVDAKLPDMEGLELARRLREIDPSIRIVMISGYFYREDVEVQKALVGEVICGFVGKPFLHDEIRTAIETSSCF